MGKKSAKTPDAPNYSQLATQQADLANQNWLKQLEANRPNQSGPTGSLTWSQDPTTGQWSQDVSLNQPQQDIFNQQQANQQQIANMGGGMLGNFDTSQIDFSGAPAAGQVGQFNQQATDLYNQLAQPQLDRSQNAQRARAAAMGIPEFGSQAGTTMNQQLADAASRSAMMAAQAGITQGNTMFGQQNQLRQQEIGNILSQRNANLGQLSGLMGLGQNVQMPQFGQFIQAGELATPDLMGAADKSYQAQLAQANAKNASKGGLMGTIGGLAGSFLGPIGGAVGSSLGSSLSGALGGGSSQAGMVSNLPSYLPR